MEDPEGVQDPSQLDSVDPDECHGALKRSFVQESKILEGLVESMVSSGGHVAMAEIKKAQLIMEKYQEQGQLLEPHLEVMVIPLMEILRRQTVSATENPKMDVVKKVCSVIHTLVTVCGYKTVVKFFPHQASDLELAVTLLETCHSEVEETSILREESTGQWETKCCLLLWLSILVLIPFDIASIDTSLAETSRSAATDVPPLVNKIITLCKDYLASPGPMREMAAVLLSRLLTRPDMKVALRSFMTWTQGTISSALETTAGVFLIPGVMGAVAAIFKAGGRDILFPITPIALEEVKQLSNASVATQSLLLRKFLVKLIQRIGLVYLPPRATTWRYKGNNSVIVQNLSSTPAQKDELIEEEEEDFDVPEEVEDIIEHLLTSLKDKDTIVRWSSAKGIGRITGRLTSSLADEVVASVLELLKPAQGDGAWHGGCLALAELARRGLLIPDRLPSVVPLIVEALHYDVRRGAHSIGAHVRDAAAYVCWAFARAYSPVLMREHFNKLAPALLTIACYDREVNCRRAASAAFQENVGRQGDYPHGIDLVNAADYFSLASRNTSYCSVAVYVAQFKEYRIPMVEELIQRKIRHWDRGLRELSAEALALLVKYDTAYFGGEVMDKLLTLVLSGDLNLRHGATLASAEMILSLKNNEFTFSEEIQKKIADTVPLIEKARLYRGKGGEIMRSVVSRFIECESLVQIPLPLNSQKKVILDTVHENLRHPNEQIQAGAVSALKAFIQGYMLPAKPANVERITVKHLQILKGDSNPAARRGSALALGALPYSFLSPHWKEVVNALCNAIHLEENPDDRDAETRVNAVRGLVAVSKCLYEAGHEAWITNTENWGSPLSIVKRKVMESLFEALDDYAIDNRGDVGSWVREAAIHGLHECTLLLCMSGDNEDLHLLDQGHTTQNLDVFDESLAVKLIGGLVKQSLEKINRVRDVAGQTLQKILHNKTVNIPFIPHKEELQHLLPDDLCINWGAPDDTIPKIVPILKFPVYRMYVMSGLFVSIGGLADSLGKTALNCLIEFLEDENNYSPPKDVKDNKTWLSKTILSIVEKYTGTDRVMVPIFKTLDLLFSKGVFPDMQTMEPSCSLEILSTIKKEVKGSKDVVKIMAAINVLAHLGLMEGDVRHGAVSQLLGLLGHRYPKVRKVCAEQFYLLLVQKGEELLDPDNVSVAEELVSETIWDGPIESIKSEREKLASLLKIRNEAATLNDTGESRERPARVATRDENASYAALLNDLL